MAKSIFDKPWHGMDHCVSSLDAAGHEVITVWTFADIAFRHARGMSKTYGDTRLVRRYERGAWREVARYVKGA